MKTSDPFKFTTKLRQAGDTIIEVLVSIAIISVVLGGAFVTTRNSQLGVRNSQEHAIALKLLENQLEQMRSNASGDGKIFTQGSAFCMYQEEPASMGSGNCLQDSSGNPVASGTQPSYTLSITDCTNVACGNAVVGSHLFTAQAAWYQVSGGNASETMAYRLYQ
jgi:prepilin-type N-terminal cleavage/methylation domain-containing protein